MRKLAVIASLIVCCSMFSLFASVSSQDTSESGTLTTEDANAPHLALDSTYIDLGRIPQGSIAEGKMRFRNTGNSDLQITRIFSECGCTVPYYSTDPIPPGGEGEIKVRFKSKSRPTGMFYKTLRIRSNADNTRVNLTVRGRILPASED